MCHPGHISYNRSDRQVLKSPKDVLMRRPPTYFAKVLNRLKPTYLPRTLKYIYNKGIMCHPGHISHNRSDRRVLKKSQGRPYETSSNIFCKSFKQIKAYISPKNIEVYTIQVFNIT